MQLEEALKAICRPREARRASMGSCVVMGVALWILACSPAFPGAIEDAWQGYRAGMRGDHNRSIILLNGAIGSGELSSKALLSSYINRGASYTTLGDFSHAIEDYDRALQIQPGNAVAIASKALALAKWGRYDEAIENFNRAVVLDPKNARTLLHRGNAHFDKGAYEKAILDYEAALRLDPSLPQAANNVDEAARRIQDPDQPCACNVTRGGDALDASTIEQTSSLARE